LAAVTRPFEDGGQARSLRHAEHDARARVAPDPKRRSRRAGLELAAVPLLLERRAGRLDGDQAQPRVGAYPAIFEKTPDRNSTWPVNCAQPRRAANSALRIASGLSSS